MPGQNDTKDEFKIMDMLDQMLSPSFRSRFKAYEMLRCVAGFIISEVSKGC